MVRTMAVRRREARREGEGEGEREREKVKTRDGCVDNRFSSLLLCLFPFLFPFFQCSRFTQRRTDKSHSIDKGEQSRKNRQRKFRKERERVCVCV
jgi:hypothetical protein